MPHLRITQSNGADDSYRVDLEFEVENTPRQTATATFDLPISEQDQEDLRWYLEDFLQFPQDPAPTIAARIERRMSQIGKDLFTKVFHSSDDARDLWAKLREKLDDTHVEVITSVEGATAIPWELIRDPKTDTPLALDAAAFVRAHPNATRQPQVPKTKSGPIRILLVICRPRAGDDVPFRSVASRLIKGLSEQTQATYQLDVLRPPTFDQLGRVLRRAKADKKPYHGVHFDGHGMYAELTGAGHSAQLLQKRFPVIFSSPRTGPHGFLLFENPQGQENVALVDGPSLGSLLVETDVPVLVLNACRSAHAEVEDESEPADPSAQPQPTQAPDDPHERVRTFGTLAQEVMDAGVAGVVAMRYNVYVVTAAQFVADLYAELVRGQTLGAAVTMGRKQLHDNPNRSIAFAPRPLQDWCVPVVYESTPIRLFPVQKKTDGLTITIQAGGTASSRGALDSELPRAPDAGFFGRDETLLALDRAFDTQKVVLLHAYAGSGKTTTAAEFARWYSLTGGIEGPVLFTSFEQYKPLPRVLDRIGEVFGNSLEQAGIHWLALDDATRRKVALDVLRQIPVLWIWDNVEPIAGFPKGAPSTWSGTEQKELADFLRDARSTQVKFLLTSRRDEQDLLGDLPRRIPVPAMPMQERVQLARALAEKQGRQITDVDDWRPLLRFTEGNPLTITVLVGQALRDGLKTKGQIDDFVTKLRAGTAKFDDEASEGRTRSLGASLSYGFDHAFSEADRKQLALLHFFQGFVDVDALKLMGRPEAERCLPEVRGLTREAGIALLDRAAEVGLLTARGGGYYTIHPAVPWFFKSLFDACFAGPPTATADDRRGEENSQAGRAMRAFVRAMGGLGDYYHNQYISGNNEVIAALSAEEANLLYARRLARQDGWSDPVISTMQGLRDLYQHRGRRAEWKSLVDEIVPDFVDPATDGPRPGRESNWSLVTEYRVLLAQEAREWANAERLQRVCVEWDRRSAEDIVDRYPGQTDPPIVSDEAQPPGSERRPTTSGKPPPFRDRLAAVLPTLSTTDRNSIRTLAASLHELGEIQRERGESACIASYKESLDLAQEMGDRALAAICAFNLGTAHKDIPAIRDLDQAEHWYRRSLELTDERDRLGRGRSQGQLGGVALARFREARKAGEAAATLLAHLNAARAAYQEALELIPEDTVNERAVIHGELGSIYGEAGDIDRALRHCRESIRYSELAGNTYSAALTRHNVAVVLAQSGRFVDAREYARAALNGFASYGSAAADWVQKTQELMKQIDEAIARKKG
jgi:tetratricopeptide (TPR) repeat protein